VKTQTQVTIQSFSDSLRRKRRKNETISKEHGNLYRLENFVFCSTLKHKASKAFTQTGFLSVEI